MAEVPDLGPWPLLANTGSTLDRAGEQRRDAAFVAAASSHADARAIVVAGELVILRQSGAAGDPLFPLAEARAFAAVEETVLIGVENGAARLGFGIAPEAGERLKERDGLLVTDLRSIAVRGLVPADAMQAIATAKALLGWHARHRFCANCGAPTKVVEAGWRRDCDACGVQHFPRTDPCVIMLAVDGERCLLGRAARFPPGMWSCLAGFVEPGEALEEAVRRETLEEVGVAVGRVVYFRSQPWPYPMSLMIGCFAEAESTKLVIDRNEVEDARWVPRGEAALMLARRHPGGLTTPPPMAIAHHMIRDYVERGTDVLGKNGC